MKKKVDDEHMIFMTHSVYDFQHGFTLPRGWIDNILSRWAYNKGRLLRVCSTTTKIKMLGQEGVKGR